MIKKRFWLYSLGITVGVICLMQLHNYLNKTETTVVISEVCPHNKTAAYDDNGNYGADYIEIYNASDESVNLEGWGLSDNKRGINRAVFDEKWIEPGKTLIIWCTANTDDTSMYNDSYVPSDIYEEGFKLTNGEACILFDSSGNAVSKVEIPLNMGNDEVYALALDDLDTYYISTSSPGYLEASKPVEYDTIDSPVFSVEGGWFQEDIQVELTATEGDIYYTLDGSDPDEDSYKYDGPITITNRTDEPNIYSAISDVCLEEMYIPDYNVDKGTVLKAVAVSDDGRSDVVSETYFVGLDEQDYDGVGIVSLSVSPDDLFGYDSGIYVVGKVFDMNLIKWNTDFFESFSTDWPAYGHKGRGWERPVTIEYFSSDHDKVFMQDVGIRIHGGYSVVNNQKNFQLYAREEYDGNDCFIYDFFEQDATYGKVMLRAGGSDDMYITKLRDVFVQSLVTDRDFGTQKAIPCAVFINGEYWGLYNVQETIGVDYISQYYDVDKDNILIIKNDELRSDNPEDIELFNEIVEFAQENDLSVEEKYRYIEDRVDIQSLIDYYVLQIYSGNVDSFKNNIAMWRSISKGFGEHEDCKWRWLVFDLDDTANMEIGYNSADIDSFTTKNFYDQAPLDGDVFFTALMNNSEFKERFVVSFMDMANNNFAPSTVSVKLWEMASVYRTGTIKSHERFRGDMVLSDYIGYQEGDTEYDDENYGIDIGYIDAFFAERYGYITDYMRKDLGLTGQLCDVNVTCSVEDASIKVNTSIIDTSQGTWHGQYFSDYPVVVECTVDGNDKFVGWQVDGEIVTTDTTLTITPDVAGSDIQAIFE